MFGTLLSPLKKRLAIEFVDEYYVDATAPPPNPEFMSFLPPGYPFPQPAGPPYAGGIPLNCWPGYYLAPGPC